MLAIDLDIGDVVLKNSGDIDLREGSLGEDNQKTSLTTGTIANDDKLAADFSHSAREQQAQRRGTLKDRGTERRRKRGRKDRGTANSELI